MKYLLGSFTNTDMIIDIGESRILEITNILKNMKWDKITHTQNKQFYVNDLCLVVQQDGKSRCERTMTFDYQYTDNLMKCNVQTIIVPEQSFPGLNKYHDTRILESIVFHKNHTTITCSNVVEYDGSIYYTCTIDGNIDNEIKNSLMLHTNFNDKVIIEHGKYHSMSVL